MTNKTLKKRSSSKIRYEKDAFGDIAVPKDSGL